MNSSMSYDTYTTAVYPAYAHMPQWSPANTYAAPLPRLLPAENYVAVSSQVVYIGRGGKVPMVASYVTVIDYRGEVLVETFVRPTRPVTDYRFTETGLNPACLATAPAFANVKQEVARHIYNKIVVGYNIWDFLYVMGLKHPASHTRDVALFLPFRKSIGSKQSIPLPQLTQQFMNRRIGASFENPVEQARASLDLFRSVERTWETMVARQTWPCDLPPSSFAQCFT